MLLIFFGRAVQFILALAMMRVVTTFLSPSEMGRMALFVSATAFFALFLVNPVGMFINRRLHSWEAQGLVRRYLDYYWAYLLAVAVLASAVLTVMNSLGSIGFQADAAWLWLLVGGSLLLNTANQTVIPSLNLLGFRGWFIGLTLATLVSGFLAAVALIFHFEPRAEYWLLGLLAGQAVFAGVGGKVFFARLSAPQVSGSAKSRPAHVGVLFEFAWPVSIAVGMNWVQSQSYRFFMEDSLGLAALGLFVAGYGISAGLIAGFESVLTTYFQPRFYKRVSSGDREEQAQAWQSYASAILPALALLIGFIIAMAPELTCVLLGADYQSSAQYVMWGALAEAGRVIAGVYGMAAHARMKTRLLLIPNLIGASMSVALLVWLTPKLGASGVGIALSLSGLAMILALHFTIRTEVALSLPYPRLLFGAVMGGLLAGGAMLIRFVSVSHDRVVESIFALGVVGLFFTALQYFLLQAVLSKRDVM